MTGITTRRTFADYKSEATNWITLAGGEYYPDVLRDACALYTPVLVMFGNVLKSSESSARLFQSIAECDSGWMRVQLLRVFKRYVCPPLPVEMTRRKKKTDEFLKEFSKQFRSIAEVQMAFFNRPERDEALCALLWEYKDRGKKGYDLTERFFELFRANFSDCQILGPERAGKDILLNSVFPDYPNANRPVDFVVRSNNGKVLAIGLARYDSDRGGGQEDDRIGGYANCVKEFFDYTERHQQKTKIIFLNDGPGLLLGSMWDDYAKIEQMNLEKIIVLTLRMVPERISYEWL